VKPNLEELNTQLSEMLANQRQNLVWATTMRKALGLKAQAKDLLNEIRRDRAQPTIEQYQWIAAAAAFANPVPALDVLATVAINAQMIVELGELYQQKFSLEQAQNVASTMGSLMLKLGLVELSTKTVSTILKSNTVTFVAGGAVQGISAAYLTRIAGLALVEYFQEQEIAINSGSALNLGKLQQTLQSVFENNQQTKFLQGFVQKGIKRLLPGTETDKLITNQKAAI
ncbi:MAG: YcjF family protein, partial [Cyanobacteria bacterium J06639_18]